MKLKYYVVEHILYQSVDGLPGMKNDPETMERIQFSSKKEAKRFIRGFIKKDPDFVKMWVAYISLTKITHQTEMIPFPYKWGKAPILEIERAKTLYKEVPISENKTSPFPLGVTEEYWEDTHLNTKADDKEDVISCICQAYENGAIHTFNELCPDHGWGDKRKHHKESSDTFQA